MLAISQKSHMAEPTEHGWCATCVPGASKEEHGYCGGIFYQ